MPEQLELFDVLCYRCGYRYEIWRNVVNFSLVIKRRTAWRCTACAAVMARP